MLRNIVLVGFMGSGKSSVGRILASLTGFALVDTDRIVVEEAGLPIPEIFRLHGEEEFRRIETAVVRSLTGRIGLVVATGGGVIVSPENRRLLAEIGPVVWLDATTDQLHQRVKHSRRPLLQTADPRRTLDELYAAREPLYREAAAVRIDSSRLSHRQTADAVLAALRDI